MKFRYIGERPIRAVTLELAGIVPYEKVLNKGDVVSTDDEYYIERLRESNDKFAETKSTAKVVTEKIVKEGK